MISKSAAYLTDANGAIYDVNAEYLFDPKISTYVTLPPGGKLTVVNYFNVKYVFIIASDDIKAKYNNMIYGPEDKAEIIEGTNLYKFEFDGSSATFEVIGVDESAEIKIYFITFEAVGITGVYASNRIRPVSRNTPLFNFIEGINIGFLDKKIAKHKVIDTIQGNATLYPIVIGMQNAIGNKRLIAGYEANDGDIYTNFYSLLDLFENKSWIIFSEELPIPLTIADMNGDGVEEVYALMYNPDPTGILSVARIDISGPPYPQTDAEMIDRVNFLESDYSEIYADPDVPPDAVINTSLMFTDDLLGKGGLAAGDMDVDGKDELLSVAVAAWNDGSHIYWKSYLGYYKLVGDKLVFHILLKSTLSSHGIPMPTPAKIKVPVPDSFNTDTLVFDYDGDIIPEIYFIKSISQSGGQGSYFNVNVIKNIDGVWKHLYVKLGEKGTGKARMTYFNGKIYIKTPEHLYVLHQDLTYTEYKFPGIGLRKMLLYGKEYLVTAVKIDDDHSTLLFFDPEEPWETICLDIDLGIEDPQPFYWNDNDNMTIFAEYRGTSGDGPGLYKIDIEFTLSVSAEIESGDIEIGAVEIKDADTDKRAHVNADGTVWVAPYDASGNRINPSTEDTLNDLYSYLSTVIPSPFQFDANGNLKVYMENPAIAYNSTNDWLKISIENDNVGLAKDTTLQSALPRNLTEISGVALTGRDWSNDFAKLQNLDTQLSAIKPGAGLISKQITVGTTEVQVDSDTTLHDEVLIKADASNTDIILIGSSGNEAYPIEPGEVVHLRKIRLSDLYVVSNTDNQKMYVITGGGWT